MKKFGQWLEKHFHTIFLWALLVAINSWIWIGLVDTDEDKRRNRALVFFYNELEKTKVDRDRLHQAYTADSILIIRHIKKCPLIK